MTARLRQHTAPGLLLPVILLCLAVFGGCSSSGGHKHKNGDQDDVNANEGLMYRNIQRSLRAGNYQEAIKALQQLESRFPFGRYAEQAQLELIYAHYMSFDMDEARSAADRFIKLHPQHPHVDYAYYLKGLASYNKDRGVFDRLFATDAAERDTTSAREAYSEFGDLLSRFPDSPYAPDAQKRMLYLRDLLARHELYVANFYMARKAYVAAANRARYVVENYSKADDVPDALALMVEVNYKLGLKDAANEALQVLAVNFPDYRAFDKNGNLVLKDQIRNRDRSWTNMMTLGLLDRPRVPPPIKLEREP